MNMAVEIEIDQSEYDRRLHGPQSVRGRLREWARARHWPEMNCWPPESAMYAVLHNPGRATNVSSDGGMAAKADRYGVSFAMWQRTIETGQAIEMMPSEYRQVVYAMYRVEKRERPRELDDAATVAKIPVQTYRRAMDMALAWLQGRMCLQALRNPQDSLVDAEC